MTRPREAICGERDFTILGRTVLFMDVMVDLCIGEKERK